jgi:hypothetical protein
LQHIKLLLTSSEITTVDIHLLRSSYFKFHNSTVKTWQAYCQNNTVHD